MRMQDKEREAEQGAYIEILDDECIAVTQSRAAVVEFSATSLRAVSSAGRAARLHRVGDRKSTRLNSSHT